MGLLDLGFTILYVDDMERAIAFYQDLLGLSIAYSAPGWVQFATQGAALVLHPRQAAATAAGGDSRVHLGFNVDDLDAEYERLLSRNANFAAPPATAGFGKHATLLDPEGNAIDLVEWKKRPVIPVTLDTTVNGIIMEHPDTMEVFEDHGIRICGGCLVLLNAPIYETAEYSGLDAAEASTLVRELNDKLAESERTTEMVTPFHAPR